MSADFDRHICLVPGTINERRDALLRYLRAGYEHGERCIFIDDCGDASSLAVFLSEGYTDFSKALREDRFRVVSKEEAWGRDETPGVGQLLRFLEEAATEASTDGLKGIRVVGSPVAVLAGDAALDALREAEERLDAFVRTRSIHFLCRYERSECAPEAIRCALETHPHVFTEGTCCRNMYFLPPGDESSGDRTRRTVNRWLDNLARSANLDARPLEQISSPAPEPRSGELAALHRVSRIGLEAGMDDAALGAIAEAIAETMSVPLVGVGIHDPDRGVIRYSGLYGVKPAAYPLVLEIPVADTMAGSVIRTGQTLVVRDLPGIEELRRRVLDALEAKVFVCTPLRVGERTLGVLSLAHTEAAEVGAETLRAVESIANYVAVMLLKKQAEDALRKNQEFLRRITDIAPVVLYVYDLDTRENLWINRENLSALGFTAAEIRDMGSDVLPALIHPDDYARYPDHLKRLRSLVEGEVADFEYRMKHRDGSWRWLHSREMCFVRSTDGAVSQIVGAATDVTERRQSVEALRESEERFRTMADSAPILLWLTNAEGDPQFVNRTYRRFFNVTAESIQNEKWAPLIHPDDLGPYREALRRAVADRTTLKAEARCRRVDGAWRWTASYAEPRFTTSGEFLGHTGITLDVTEQKAAEEALRKSEQRLRGMFDNAGVGIVEMGEGDRFIEVNEHACRMLGYTREEFLRLAVSDVTHPEDRPLSRMLNRKLHYGDTDRITYEKRYVKADGTPLWVHVTVTAVRDSAGRFVRSTGVFEDISYRKATEAALKESEERFRRLVETAPDAVFVQTRGCFAYVNSAALKLFGAQSASQLLGQSIIEHFHPSQREQVLERMQRLNARRESVPPVEEVCVRFDGSAVDAEVSAVPIVYQGIDGALVFARDITERKRAAQELHALETKMVQAQKLESLGVLAGGIAHDFNNLLTAILGHAELAMMDLPESFPARESVEQIRVSARNAAGLTRQMLAYAGKSHVATERVDVGGLVREIANLLEVSVSKKCTLLYRMAKGLPAVQGDPAQLRQVVMNLIVNASEALEGGEGTVTVAAESVRCNEGDLRGNYLGDCLPAGRYVCIAVSDTGCGMDADTLDRIFDPFFSTKFTGRGLGLAAVLGIVRSHRGAVKVSSEVGKGTTFSVYLPAHGAEANSVGQESAKADYRGSECILVADDEVGVRMVAKGILRRAGFRVLVANDGQEALDLYRSQPDDIHLVLLDMTMPRMDGDEALREMRRLRPNVRVVLCSGYSEHDVAGRFVGEEPTHFLQKPFERVALLKTVREALDA